MGSFYTVVGLRLPKKESFFFSRSKCDECKHVLGAFDLIPIISYFLLGRRCRYCKSRIDPLSTYIEFFTGVLFAVAYYSFGFSYSLLIALGIISLLVIVIVSDLTYLIIPDQVLIFFSLYFFVIKTLEVGIINSLTHVLYGILLFLLMYLIMLLGNKVFKKESMGGGDVKMMFLFGLILDPLLGMFTIFLGSLFALPISFCIYLMKKENVIPFGPFLLIAFAFLYFTKITPEMIISFFRF